MKPIEIVIIIVLALIVAATVGYLIWRKKKYGSATGCCKGCGNCKYRSEEGGCPGARLEKNEDADDDNR